MGYWKNKLIEWEDRGYGSIDTIVCSCCFGDYAIKAFIKKNGTKQKCSYCGKTRVATDLEEVLGLIVRSASAEYEDANGCMGWDHEEGGFHGAPTYDNWDFVRDILNYEMRIENEELVRDIIDTLNHSVTWCEDNPYNLRIHEEDYLDWQNFCRSVKSRRSSLSKLASSYDILDGIGEYIDKLGLIVRIKKSDGFYRSRPHEKFEKFNLAKDIGSAPSCRAKENRMSPEGMSMFYGAEDIDTTLLEIRADAKQSVTSAKFHPTKTLHVLDLTKLEQLTFPSLFDEDNRIKRSPLIFLKNCAADISKPIYKKESKEYRPTQVFTEYIKNIYKLNDHEILDGIIYKSSWNGRKCYVLFFDHDQCTDDRDEKTKKLWMDEASLTRMN